MSFTSEFKEFILRGNVVDLAVGVVIGAAFGDVVKAFTVDLLTPLTKIPTSKNAVDFKDLAYTLGGGTFKYGDFINVVVSFLLIAFVVFVFVVKPVNWLMDRMKIKPPEPETTRECPECFSKIPLAATRCAFCTAQVPAAA